MIGGRKTRSNKGVRRGPRMKNLFRQRFRPVAAKRTAKRVVSIKKQRSNKGVKFRMRTGRTRSGRRFRQG